MNIEFWKIKCDFDKQDAKIVIPIILLLIALIFSKLNKEILILTVVTYYFMYFFYGQYFTKMRGLYFNLIKHKCPSCKSRKIYLQGYQGYKSDEHYPYYRCIACIDALHVA